MVDKQQGNEFPKKDVMMGQDVNVPYDMTTAGEEDTTLWDNMVNALKPDLRVGKIGEGKASKPGMKRTDV